MMMRVLEAGGLTVDHSPEIPEAMIMFRNPGGMYENRVAVLDKIFLNSFKLPNAGHLINVPDDYRRIYIGRPLSKILASWNDVATRGAEQGRNMAGWADTSCQMAIDRNEKWTKLLSVSTGFLILDYDTVVANPAAMARSVADHINTPIFSFNEANAIAVVDRSLYLERI
jgi:hypothetical protein